MANPTIDDFKSHYAGTANASVTFTTATLNGWAICFAATDYDTLADIPTPGGTAVTTWSLKDSIGNQASLGLYGKVFVGQITNATGTVTVGKPPNGDLGIIVHALGGASGTFVSSHNSAAVDTNPQSALGVTPTGADDMLLGYWMTSPNRAFSTPTGMTIDTQGTNFSQWMGAHQGLSSGSATGNRDSTAAGGSNFGFVSFLVAAAATAVAPSRPIYPVSQYGNFH